MKEIKFRGKRLSDGKLIYGDLVHVSQNVGGGVTIRFFDNNGNLKGTAKVDPESVAQFVGYDADGKEVYEGDTVFEESIGSDNSKGEVMLVGHVALGSDKYGIGWFPSLQNTVCRFKLKKEENHGA